MKKYFKIREHDFVNVLGEKFFAYELHDVNGDDKFVPDYNKWVRHYLTKEYFPECYKNDAKVVKMIKKYMRK